MSEKKKNGVSGKGGMKIVTRSSCPELLSRFYYPDEIQKLSLIRELAEEFWADAFSGRESREVEEFLVSFVDRHHPSHKINVKELRKAAPPHLDSDNLVKQAGIIAFSFLDCSNISPPVRHILDRIKKDPPSHDFLPAVSQAIKFSKLERTAAVAG